MATATWRRTATWMRASWRAGTSPGGGAGARRALRAPVSGRAHKSLLPCNDLTCSCNKISRLCPEEVVRWVRLAMRMRSLQAVRPRHRITRDPRVLDAAAAVALLRNSNPAPARAHAPGSRSGARRPNGAGAAAGAHVPGSRSGVRRPQTPAAAAAAAAAQAVRPHVPGSRSGARRPSAPLAASIKVGGVPLTMNSSRPRQVRWHRRQPTALCTHAQWAPSLSCATQSTSDRSVGGGVTRTLRTEACHHRAGGVTHETRLPPDACV
jgi:hypothetical protein